MLRYVGSSTTIGVCVTNPNYQDPSWHLSGVKHTYMRSAMKLLKGVFVCKESLFVYLFIFFGWFKKKKFCLNLLFIFNDLLFKKLFKNCLLYGKLWRKDWLTLSHMGIIIIIKISFSPLQVAIAFFNNFTHQFPETINWILEFKKIIIIIIINSLYFCQ